mmetsp:Transcript_23130/g.57892  ORF Transcript_23130/g.57892 Transcript_23130/m.57892 type:complete len:323 (-) Transcript_23130:944-1912(-)
MSAASLPALHAASLPGDSSVAGSGGGMGRTHRPSASAAPDDGVAGRWADRAGASAGAGMSCGDADRNWVAPLAAASAASALSSTVSAAAHSTSAAAGWLASSAWESRVHTVDALPPGTSVSAPPLLASVGAAGSVSPSLAALASTWMEGTARSCSTVAGARGAAHIGAGGWPSASPSVRGESAPSVSRGDLTSIGAALRGNLGSTGVSAVGSTVVSAVGSTGVSALPSSSTSAQRGDLRSASTSTLWGDLRSMQAEADADAHALSLWGESVPARGLETGGLATASHRESCDAPASTDRPLPFRGPRDRLLSRGAFLPLPLPL